MLKDMPLWTIIPLTFFIPLHSYCLIALDHDVVTVLVVEHEDLALPERNAGIVDLALLERRGGLEVEVREARPPLEHDGAHTAKALHGVVRRHDVAAADEYLTHVFASRGSTTSKGLARLCSGPTTPLGNRARSPAPSPC